MRLMREMRKCRICGSPSCSLRVQTPVAIQGEIAHLESTQELLRTELAESKGTLASCRAQLSRQHAQLVAIEDAQHSKVAQEDTDAKFRLSACEYELAVARRAEVAARAEAERLRSELRVAHDWQSETEVGALDRPQCFGPMFMLSMAPS
jgi:hypothetical protein